MPVDIGNLFVESDAQTLCAGLELDTAEVMGVWLWRRFCEYGQQRAGEGT